MMHQAPVLFRYSLLLMLGTENGEELVATAGNIDVSPISTITLCWVVLIRIQTEWAHQWNKWSR